MGVFLFFLKWLIYDVTSCFIAKFKSKYASDVTKWVKSCLFCRFLNIKKCIL